MMISKRARLDGTSVLVLAGELDIASAPEARDTGLELIASHGRTKVLVDMTNVTFMDSTGIGARRAQERSCRRRSTAALLDPSQRVTRALEITGLTSVFTIERLDT